jgi:hypothetical protein
MASFEVTLYGQFWVTPEDIRRASNFMTYKRLEAVYQLFTEPVRSKYSNVKP